MCTKTKLECKNGTIWCHLYIYDNFWYNPEKYEWQRVDHMSTCSTLDEADETYELYRGLSFGPNDFWKICPEQFPF